MSIREQVRLEVATRDGWICQICLLPVNPAKLGGDGAQSIDHIVRRADGGTDDIANLRLTHRICNELRASPDGVRLIARDNRLRRRITAEVQQRLAEGYVWEDGHWVAAPEVRRGQLTRSGVRRYNRHLIKQLWDALRLGFDRG